MIMHITVILSAYAPAPQHITALKSKMCSADLSKKPGDAGRG